MNQPLADGLKEIALTKALVEDFADRLDKAVLRYLELNQTEFPGLTNMESEALEKVCLKAIDVVTLLIPNALSRWQNTEPAEGIFDTPLERLRELWTRRRDVFRMLDTILQLRAKRIALPAGPGSSPLDPRGPVYWPRSRTDRFVNRIAWSSGVVAALAILVILYSVFFGWHAKLVVSIAAGLTATIPPMWFSFEYFFFYRKEGLPGSLELFKQGQQSAIAIWAGFTAALLALAASDWTNSQPKLHCDLVAGYSLDKTPLPVELLCK